MKYLVIAFMLICSIAYACDYCIEHPGEKEIWNNGIGANNGTHQLQKDHIILLQRINELDKKISQMYPMLADLEVKFMGNERYQQISNPDNIPEVVRQKIHSDKMTEIINKKHGV